MSIQSIHFINRYPVISLGTKQSPQASPRNAAVFEQNAKWVFAKAEFGLGLGPCGKVVTRLDAHQTENTFTISQMHEDGTIKDFIYQMSDIAGRIVVEYTEEQENV